MRALINAAGPITPLGAGLVAEPVIDAVAQALRRPAEIAELQRSASAAIRRAFDCEAGAVLGSTAAAIASACAAAMTGTDLARVEQLPDTSGMKHRVVLQRAHDCWFGAYVGQMIRISGARIDYVGTRERATESELEAALSPDTAAALFVASHHVPSEGTIPLAAFIRICKHAGVPVIIDAAGTVDLDIYLKAGASLVLASAHKNFGGLTAGIVAGQKDLVDACLLQERGIGRAMKVGKEGIVGVIAGLGAWSKTRLAQREAEWRKRAERVCAHLAPVSGASATLETDPPEHRIYRARISMAKAGGVTAAQLAEQLKGGDPPIRVWEAGLKAGHFAIDPRCLSDDEADFVCQRLIALLSTGSASPRA